MTRTPKGTLVVQTYDPSKAMRTRVRWVLLWLASLVAVYLVCRYTMIPGYAAAQTELRGLRSQLEESLAELDGMKTQLVQRERANQVSDLAGNTLEKELADSKDQIAALRSELSFYEKVVSGGADQAGLAINDLEVRGGQNPGVYRFIVTLSQNLKKDRMAKGGVTLSIRGISNGKLSQLNFKQLSGADGPAQVPFDFKYFQRIEGSIMLPDGFVPDQVQVVANGDAGVGRVQREFEWKAASETKSS